MSLRQPSNPDPLEPAPPARPVEPGTHFRQGDVLLLAIEPDDLPRRRPLDAARAAAASSSPRAR